MGSGKSTASALLRKWMPVNDCDAINARLLEPGQAGYLALQNNGLLKTDDLGNLDRQSMADEIFSDPQKRRQVEAILHPLIRKTFKDWMEEQEGLCAVEVPLLFESGMEEDFDEVWTVLAEQNTALARLQSGRNISRKEALRRLALQYPPEKKAAKSDALLYNDKTIADLEAQIEALLMRKGLMDDGRQQPDDTAAQSPRAMR